MIRRSKRLSLAVFAALHVLGCDDDESAPMEGDPSQLVVKGVSGDDVLVDRRWDRGCIPGVDWFGNPVWQHFERTLIGLELVTTQIDFQNDSTTPDCTTGRAAVVENTQALTDDEILVPFTWVDAEGNPADAPPGLEGVTMSNGATAVVTIATFTPETASLAELANEIGLCEVGDWAPGVRRDIVECFTQGLASVKGTMVVDDRTTPWAIYDGVGDFVDYPTQVLAVAPHHGPLDP